MYNINFKNVLAGIGSAFIVIVAIMVGMSSFANYDLWQGDQSRTIGYDSNISVDGPIADSPDGVKACGYQKSYELDDFSYYGMAFDKENKNILVSNLNSRKIVKLNDNGQSDYNTAGYAQGMVFDNNGNMYAVYPQTNLNVVKKFDANGKEIKSWSKYKQNGKDVNFYQPGYIAFASGINTFFIAQIGVNSSTVINKFNISSDPVAGSLVGVNGAGYGKYSSIGGMISDEQGNLYVVDTNANKVVKYPATGSASEWGGFGTSEGKFNKPAGIAIGPDGFIYIVDSGNNRIQVFTSNGVFVTKFGQSGSGELGDFKNVKNITFDQDGNMYVLDAGNSRVQKFGKTCGTVKIIKNTQPATDQEFDFWTGAPMNHNFKLKNKQSYTFSIMNEVMTPSFGEEISPEYSTSVSCVSSPSPLPKGDSFRIISKNSASVSLKEGSTVTCTFSNCRVGQVCDISNDVPITE